MYTNRSDFGIHPPCLWCTYPLIVFGLVYTFHGFNFGVRFHKFDFGVHPSMDLVLVYTLYGLVLRTSSKDLILIYTIHGFVCGVHLHELFLIWCTLSMDEFVSTQVMKSRDYRMNE